MTRMAVVVAAALASPWIPACGDDGGGGSDADGGGDVEDDGVGPDADADPDAQDEDGGGDVGDEGGEDGAGVCEEQFWIWDLSVMPPVDRQICASKHGEGANTYVWVEDAQWGTTVDETVVEEILRRWETETPPESIAPDQGIFEIETGYFGAPPDEFDGDPKIYILLYEIMPYRGTEFDGYFRTTDQTSEDGSNRREMIHINAAGSRRPSSAYMIAVQAHEFNHMIQWTLDPNEESWLSEAFAELSMILVGYTTDSGAANAWVRDPSPPLVAGGAIPRVDYGAVYLFGLYLYERLGATGFHDLVADAHHGVASVQTAVALAEPDATFLGFFADFAMAVALDDETVGDARWGFLDADLPAAGVTSVTFPADARTVTVPEGGIKLARVPLDGAAHPSVGVDVSIGAGARIGARVAVVDPTAGTTVGTVVPGTHLTLSGVPATAEWIELAFANEDDSSAEVAFSVADE